MRYDWIGRFFFWLFVLGAVAIVIAIGAQLGLEAAGATQADAVIVSTAAAVAIALSAADVFTPIGSNLVRQDFEADPKPLVLDFAAAGVVGAVAAGLSRALGAWGVPYLGGQTVATFLGVALGYVAFIALNRRQYGRPRPETGSNR